MLLQPAWALMCNNTICIAFKTFRMQKLHILSPDILDVCLHIHFSSPSAWSWRSHWFSTCGPMWLILYSYSDLSTTTQLQLQRCSHLHWPPGLQLCLWSPCSHTLCAQNKPSEPRFHSAKCISEDFSLWELNDASAFQGKLHSGNINPTHIIQGHLFQ